MNRWTIPTVTAALLSVPAVLLGWNASAVAASVAAPWVRQSTDGAPSDVRASSLEGDLPASVAPEVAPTTAPAIPGLPVGNRVPSSGVGRSVVHTVTHTVGTDEKQEDDVSTTDETPEPTPPNTRPSETPGPVVPSDPTNPNVPAPSDATVTTPGGQEIPEGEYRDEGNQRYYNRGGQRDSGNIPPQPSE
jgi:hypothetical protein